VTGGAAHAGDVGAHVANNGEICGRKLSGQRDRQTTIVRSGRESPERCGWRELQKPRAGLVGGVD